MVRLVTRKAVPAHVRALVLEVCCTDEEGEDVDVPYIKYLLPANALGYAPVPAQDQ